MAWVLLPPEVDNLFNACPLDLASENARSITHANVSTPGSENEPHPGCSETIAMPFIHCLVVCGVDCGTHHNGFIPNEDRPPSAILLLAHKKSPLHDQTSGLPTRTGLFRAHTTRAWPLQSRGTPESPTKFKHNRLALELSCSRQCTTVGD